MTDWVNRRGFGGTGGLAVVTGFGDATQGANGIPDPGNSLAILEDIAGIVYDLPSAVHRALDNDPTTLMLRLAGLGEAMHAIMDDAKKPSSLFPKPLGYVTKIASVLDDLGKLQQRLGDITSGNGDAKDWAGLALDVTSYAVAFAKVTTGPTGWVLGAAADAAIIGIKTMVEEWPE